MLEGWNPSLKTLIKMKEDQEHKIEHCKREIQKAEASLAEIMAKIAPKAERKRKKLREQKRQEEIRSAPWKAIEEEQFKYERPPKDPFMSQRIREYPEYSHLQEQRNNPNLYKLPYIPTGFVGSRDYPQPLKSYSPVGVLRGRY
jgi:hypothetical protein